MPKANQFSHSAQPTAPVPPNIRRVKDEDDDTEPVPASSRTIPPSREYDSVIVQQEETAPVPKNTRIRARRDTATPAPKEESKAVRKGVSALKGTGAMGDEETFKKTGIIIRKEYAKDVKQLGVDHDELYEWMLHDAAYAYALPALKKMKTEEIKRLIKGYAKYAK